MLQREAEKFAPEPLIQNLRPVVNDTERSTMPDTVDESARSASSEFGTGEAHLRPYQQRGIRDLLTHERPFVVPPNAGKAMRPDPSSVKALEPEEGS